jgi:Fe2+ or Zn2+ uptake regulation protein
VTKINTGKYKKIILDILKKNPVHPNVYELYQLVKAEYPRIGMATVYRNLDEMAGKGMVLKFNTGAQFDRFDGTVKEHYHMVCNNCGKVIDIPADIAEKINEKTEKLTGNIITGHKLTFEGICKECQDNRHNKDKEGI